MAHLYAVRYRSQGPEGLKCRTESLVGGKFGAGLALNLSMFRGSFEEVRISLGVPIRRVLF